MDPSIDEDEDIPEGVLERMNSFLDIFHEDVTRKLKPESTSLKEPAEEIELQRIDHMSGEVFKEILVCFLDMFKDQHSEPRDGINVVRDHAELCKSLVEDGLPFPCQTLETGSIPEKACTTTLVSFKLLRGPAPPGGLVEDFFVPEIDVMIVVDMQTLAGPEHTYKLTAKESNPCFVTLSSNQFDTKATVLIENVTVNILQHGKQCSYLSPKRFRLYMRELLTSSLVGRVISQHTIKEVFEHGPAIQIRSMTELKQEADIERSFSINEGERHANEFDMDMVPAIKLPVWPEVAQAWINRSRKWTSQDLIRQIVSEGVLLVCKPPPNGDEMTDWRLSFSKAEKMLLRNSEQPCRQHAHRIFKYIIKHILRPPRFISSYHCKTIVLWASERLPPKHWEWERLAHCVLGLLDDLLYSLSTRSCPHYFIPEVNLFQDIPADFLTTACQKLADIRRNPIIERPEMYESTARELIQSYNAEFWGETTDEAMVCKLLLQHKFGYSQEFIQNLKTDGDMYYLHGKRGRIPPSPPLVMAARKLKEGNRSTALYRVQKQTERMKSMSYLGLLRD